VNGFSSRKLCFKYLETDNCRYENVAYRRLQSVSYETYSEYQIHCHNWEIYCTGHGTVLFE